MNQLTSRGLKILLPLALASVPAMAAASCESLASLSLADATITGAQNGAAGGFTLPGNPNGRGRGGGGNIYKDLPAFCRVTATLKPTSDSDIKIEVWLPSADWNQKYEAVGNGGWAGVISYSAMAEALRDGYATSSTDTGHTGGSGGFALGHPEKLIDFGWRSEHEMTVKSKAIINAFYGSGERLAYWNGCSTGGRQGLKEAQRFPADYDGIITGAPANRTGIGLWIASAELKDPASYIPPAKYPMMHQAVLAACDARDGVKDGLIEDPTRCKFDPKTIECKGADSPSCLTAAQVETARKTYTTATNPRTGQKLFPSLVPGSELGWAVLGGPEPSPVVLDQYKYVVFKNPAWDWRTFDFDRDNTRSEEPENLVMNGTDPNLKAFFAHHGKLLMYHGWADPNISPLATVQYYKSVVDTMGGEKKTSDSVRLFMVPGMGHCGGGEGPNKMDLEGTLDKWVDKGTAPDKIVASHATAGKVGSHASSVPVSASGEVCRLGQYRRSREFLVRSAVTPGTRGHAHFFALAVLIALAPAIAQAQKVTVEIDNAWVRASRVNLAPHEKLAMREYPAAVIVYLTDVHQRITGGDGKVREVERKTGETAYVEASARAEENISRDPLEEVVIELKPGAPRFPAHSITLDPVKLDPKYHTVDFENERVRVLRTVLEPHIKSPLHEHPSYVVVYVTELHTTMALSDGRLVDNPRKKGEIAWRDAMKHSTENIGGQTAMEIQVELK